MDLELALAHILQYRRTLDELVGLHCDSLTAFHLFRHQIDLISQQDGPPPKVRRVFFGRSDPRQKGAEYRHSTTLQELIDRNSGPNLNTLTQACIVMAYMHWEDQARPGIAKALNIEKNSVKSSVFADLGKYRHAIVHNRGVLRRKPEILTAVKLDASVVLDAGAFEDLFDVLASELERLPVTTCAST